jgi:outer membrane protein
MKHSGVVLILFGLGCWTAVAQTPGSGTDSLTITEAINQVLSTHPAVNQAAAGVDAAAARVGEARSGYYPSVAADLSYTRIGPVAALAFPGLGEFKLYPENNYDAHVGLHQMVFDFGRRSAGVDLSQTGVQVAADNETTVKSGLAFQTIQAFYAILFLERSLDVQDREIAALREHLDVTQKRVEGGSATDFDVMTTRVRVAAAETQKIDIQNLLTDQELALARLLGLPSTATPAVKGSFDLAPVSLATDSLIAMAFAHRSELAVTRDAVRAAELQHHLANLQELPSLSVGLSYGLKNGYIPNLDVLRGNWAAGVLVQVPIFTGYRTESRLEETAAMSKSAQANQSVVERTITLEVQQALEGVRSARDKVETSNVRVQQATDAVEKARVQYEAGAVTNLDLLDAETSLAQAQLAQLSAVYQYTLSRYSLDRATGMLPIGPIGGTGNQ